MKFYVYLVRVFRVFIKNKRLFMTLRQRLYAYARLMRLDKPIGSLLLLWPTWWALWLASDGEPSLRLVIIFTLGVFVMRSAGCVMNDIADRDFDRHVERTKTRPLAQGIISLREALVLFIVLILGAFALALQLDTLTVRLAVVALILAIIYPFMKRITHWPQLVLGAAFNWAIIMAYAAQLGHVPAQAWCLFAIGVLWTFAYDTEYALVDKEDDVKIHLKSTAIILGNKVIPCIAGAQGLAWSGLVLMGLSLGKSPAYYVVLVFALGLLFYQLHLISGEQKEACFKAFKQNNWYGLLVWLAILIG